MLHFIKGNKLGRYTDQQFLRSVIWPQIKNSALTHDRCFQYGPNLGSVLLPSPLSSMDHIGSNLGSKSIKLQPDLPDGTQVFFYFVLDGSEKYGLYKAIIKNECWSTLIPDAYITLFSEKRLKIDWLAI